MKYFNRYIFPALVCLIVSFAVFPAQTVQAVNSLASGIFGGGYGSTGTTINSAGDISTNGNLVVDGTATIGGIQSAAQLNVGGGYGATGSTLNSSGDGQFNGSLTVDSGINADSISISSGGASTGVTASSVGIVTDGYVHTGGEVTAGGGTGFTGVTLGTTGNVNADGDLVVGGTGTITGNSILTSADIGGGAGATGTTITSAGAITTDGAGDFNSTLNVDGNSTLLSVDIGGGSGGSGATITSAGAGTFDATVTANALSIGGGFGSTGVSVSSAGALQVDGKTDLAGGVTAGAATFWTDGLADFAGGYGSSGVTIYGTGVLLSDSSISALGDIFSGGGYGFTGVTLESDGDVKADGNLTIGGTITGTMADAELAAIAGLTSAADKAPVFSGSGTAALLTVKSGTWTPTISSTVNIDSTSGAVGRYQQIGNVVIGSISVSVDPTAATTLTTFEFTLPVTSNFANSIQGTGVGIFNANAGAVAICYSNSTTDLLVGSFTSIGTASQSLRINFQYDVI